MRFVFMRYVIWSKHYRAAFASVTQRVIGGVTCQPTGVCTFGKL